MNKPDPFSIAVLFIFLCPLTLFRLFKEPSWLTFFSVSVSYTLALALIEGLKAMWAAMWKK